MKDRIDTPRSDYNVTYYDKEIPKNPLNTSDSNSSIIVTGTSIPSEKTISFYYIMNDQAEVYDYLKTIWNPADLDIDFKKEVLAMVDLSFPNIVTYSLVGSVTLAVPKL